MKKVSLLGAFCGLLMLTSCGALKSYVADYSVGLATVESPADAKQQFGETKVVPFDEKGVRTAFVRIETENGFIFFALIFSTLLL